MKKAIRRLCIGLSVTVFFLILYSMWNIDLYKQEPEMASDNPNVIEILQNEEGTACYAGEGDPGLSDEELQSPIPGPELMKTRSTMVCLLYNSTKVIPFCEGGRYWKTDFPELPAGSYNSPGSETGVDSLGLVMWAYYAIFHEFIEEPSHAYRLGNRIGKDDLKPGDIGMSEYDAGIPNHFGIFLGYDDHIPVFAHCSSYPFPGFPNGCVQLCTIQNSITDFYAGAPAEDFKYFTRPDVLWENDQNAVTLSELTIAEPTGEKAAIRSCIEFGTYLLEEWTAGNYDGVIDLLNHKTAQRKGFQFNKDRFIEKAESMRLGMVGKNIRVYNISESEEAVVVRYCLAGLKTDEMARERIVDSAHCQWLDLTLYMENGSIVSFLPFNAGMFENALQYGYTQN